ncbi:MAG TPA: YicC/YloC family endoribonuclease [Gemmatimonadota bacterium]|nr:YicC/YloC family endoribonuclease [Gemmatimonadota bacterium]
MIRSMTGYGRGEVEAGGYRFLAEIKSVNHRFLNTHIRLPREFSHLESFVAARCAARCERGHLAVNVEIGAAQRADGGSPRLNHEVLDRLLEIAAGLEGLPGVRGGMSVEALLELPGVLVWEPETVLEETTFRDGAGRALDAALDGVVASRSTEGQALAGDFATRLATLRELRNGVEALAPEREARERERLQSKVRALVGDEDAITIDQIDQRVAQEIVFLADRLDVSEELTRMAAHLDHFAAELEASGEAVGRKLTFLLQELGREANTIASKSNDAEMQRLAIDMKSELEKMREQAENVE